MICILRRSGAQLSAFMRDDVACRRRRCARRSARSGAEWRARACSCRTADSPTRPSVSPRVTSKATPSTARKKLARPKEPSADREEFGQVLDARPAVAPAPRRGPGATRLAARGCQRKSRCRATRLTQPTFGRRGSSATRRSPKHRNELGLGVRGTEARSRTEQRSSKRHPFGSSRRSGRCPRMVGSLRGRSASPRARFSPRGGMLRKRPSV